MIRATALFKLCNAEYTLISLSVNFSFASKTNFDISTRRSLDISIVERFAEIIGALENTSRYDLFKYKSAT